MSEVTETVVAATVVEPKSKAKKAKAVKAKPKKQKVVKAKAGPGRPRLYDYDVVHKVLRKHEGKQRGLRAALEELNKRKGYENMSYNTLAVMASNARISFGQGKPTAKKVVKKKIANAAKAAA